MIKLTDIKEGSIFSELSTYVTEKVRGNVVYFKHLESNETVKIDFSYIQGCMVSGDQYEEEVIVGKEDKKYTEKQIEEIINSGKFKNELEVPSVGSLKQLGIRSIFHSIPYKTVFTVTFRKKDKELSDKQYNALIAKKKAEFIDAVTKAQTSKKGVKKVAEDLFVDFLNQKIERIIPGDLRTLRGYKLSSHTETGFYICKDLEFPDGEGENTRLVNINSIESLIVNGKKYIVE